MTLDVVVVGGRVISDTFSQVQFSTLNSSKVVHFVLSETTYNKYHISPNKPQRLLNFETARCGAY